jgi:hypothetical protein
MSNGFGQSPRKQAAGQGTGYGGPTIQTSEGTVYNGPAVPPRGGAYNGAAGAGQAYSPAKTLTARLSTAPSADAHKSGSVFFLIAVLSILNTVLAMSGAGIALALGLGITRKFDAELSQGGSIASVLAVNALVASVFVLIGVFARQGKSAAILIGLLLYAGDTVLLALEGVALHIPSLVVHAIFLFIIYRSYRAVQA